MWLVISISNYGEISIENLAKTSIVVLQLQYSDIDEFILLFCGHLEFEFRSNAR